MKSVCALVVTYNRSKYLQKALEGIINQQKEVSGVLIFNNNSTDNTEEMLIDLGYIDAKCDEIAENHLYETERDGRCFYYYHNQENLGGAGGFANGIKLISKLDYDYVWIMDDDVYPEPDCLEKILEQKKLIDKDKIFQKLDELEVKIVTFFDENYPSNLKNIFYD